MTIYRNCPHCNEACDPEVLQDHLAHCETGYSQLPQCPECGYRFDEDTAGSPCPCCGEPLVCAECGLPAEKNVDGILYCCEHICSEHP